MVQAKFAVQTAGVHHYPGNCNKCRVSFFDKYWQREKFIAENKGTPDELGASYERRQARRQSEFTAACLQIETRDCDKCEYRIEILKGES